MRPSFAGRSSSQPLSRPSLTGGDGCAVLFPPGVTACQKLGISTGSCRVSCGRRPRSADLDDVIVRIVCVCAMRRRSVSINGKWPVKRISNTRRLVLGLGIITIGVCAALPFRRMPTSETAAATSVSDESLTLGEGVALQVPGQTASSELPARACALGPWIANRGSVKRRACRRNRKPRKSHRPPRFPTDTVRCSSRFRLRDLPPRGGSGRPRVRRWLPNR